MTKFMSHKLPQDQGERGWIMCPNLDISLVNMTIYAGYCIFACESWYQSFCVIPKGFVLNWGYILFFQHTITFCGIIISCTRELALKIKIKIIHASTKQSPYECTKMIHIEFHRQICNNRRIWSGWQDNYLGLSTLSSLFHLDPVWVYGSWTLLFLATMPCLEVNSKQARRPIGMKLGSLGSTWIELPIKN